MQLSSPTYQLIKDETVLMETDAINAEHAIDTFYLQYPQMFTEQGYEVKVKKLEVQERG